MKICEITSRSGKEIKKLQHLYLSFILNPSYYEKLVSQLNYCKLSADSDVAKEANLIDSKLMDELFRILSK